ncbi:MAG TPA: rhomboid family intramembrane serine protease [Pyrinomonadaceae bacterium]|nr:rhomboid family intramembrane serine protease [Pyrinomonadaceae bacterium]
MFPIGDDNSDRTITPFVNYAFIGLNILVFLALQQLGSNEHFTYAFTLVPREITSGTDIVATIPIINQAGKTVGEIQNYSAPLGVYFNVISSMFMHGSIMHIAGNMLFLWIFGDNLENLLGHVRYAAFYLFCGVAAAFGQIIMGPDSLIPMLGASGAISGVLGGYVLLFPTRQVRAIIFNFLTTVPAFVAIGIWIVYQLVSGYFTDPGTGGVAYAAHIGGFIAGAATVHLFALGRRP